jgi:hypothetical protein
MIERLYQIVWSRIGGRPWTYTIRDSSRWSAVVGAGLAAIGLAGLRAPRPVILAVGVGIGFILGHLYW